MVTSSDLPGCWFYASYIRHVHILGNSSLSLLGIFLSPKVAFRCHSFYKPWLLVTSKIADFMVMTFTMSNYPLYQVSAQGFIHMPRNSFYMPCLPKKSDLQWPSRPLILRSWHSPCPNTPLNKFWPAGLIHKPRNSIYMPWLLNKVTSSDLRGR